MHYRHMLVAGALLAQTAVAQNAAATTAAAAAATTGTGDIDAEASSLYAQCVTEFHIPAAQASSLAPMGISQIAAQLSANPSNLAYFESIISAAATDPALSSTILAAFSLYITSGAGGTTAAATGVSSPAATQPANTHAASTPKASAAKGPSSNAGGQSSSGQSTVSSSTKSGAAPAATGLTNAKAGGAVAAFGLAMAALL